MNCFFVMTLSLYQNYKGVWHWTRSQPILWLKRRDWTREWFEGFIFQKGHQSSVIFLFHFTDEKTAAQDGGLNCLRVQRMTKVEFTCLGSWALWFNLRTLHMMTWLYLSIINYLFIYLCFMLTSHWKWRVGAPEWKVTGDWRSEGPQAGLRDAQSTGDAPALLMGHSLSGAPQLCCVRKVLERGLQKPLWSQLDPRIRGRAWGSSRWLFELGRGVLAHSCGLQQTCEELLPKWRSFENRPGGGRGNI